MENTKTNKIIDFLKFIGSVILGISIIIGIYFGVDVLFKDLLPYLSRAVLSNFIVFALIIIYTMKVGVHPVKMIEDMQQTVVDEIYKSESAKVDSETRLTSIQESVSNIENEINAIIQKSTENAELVGKKIIADAENTALIVQENMTKSIENAQTILRNDLIKRASLASVEVAKKHIINELSWNQGLHDKLIDESVEALEGVSYNDQP